MSMGLSEVLVLTMTVANKCEQVVLYIFLHNVKPACRDHQKPGLGVSTVITGCHIQRWSLRTGGLYTEVLHCSGVDIVCSPVMVT